MCNCVEVLKKTIVKQFGTDQKIISSVVMAGEGYLSEAFFIDFKATVKRQKKRIVVPVKATFCPFCGESLKKEEENKNV